MIVKPFRGLRPRPDLAEKIPSYPYDVINTEEARELAQDDPHSFLHVVRPEIDLEPGVDPASDPVYDQGRRNLARMIEDGWLVRDENPAYYVYRLTMGEHSQIGIMGASAVDDYIDDRIKKHEHTRREKEQDRVRLVQALAVHPGPVLLTYAGLPEINAIIRGVAAREPTVDFKAPDGIEHALWVVDDPAACSKIEQLLKKVKNTYIADGHHRAAAAARVGTELRSREAEAQGERPSDYFLTVLFPADQLNVLDYNRVVADLNGLAPEAFLERVERAGFDIEPDPRARRPPHRQTFGMYLDGKWYLLTARPEIVSGAGVVDKLDVSVLADHLLGPVLGIGDVRKDKRIDFVGGVRGMEGLEKRVDGGDSAVAFALYPTSLEDVMQVADAAQVMPPKSTWFEPKLRSGMVVQPIEGDTL